MPHDAQPAVGAAPVHRAHPALVLWDIDGTLLRSGRGVVQGFLDAVEQVCRTRPDPTGLDFGGRLDPDIAGLLIGAAGGPAELVPAVLDRFEQLIAERRPELEPHIAPLAGVRDLVGRFAAADVLQTVVTGNLESVGRLKLEAAGLVPPLEPAWAGFGAGAPTRAEVAAVSLGRVTAAGWAGSRDDCWIIGDTPRDLACAREVGVRCALVATGRHPFAALAGLGADLVLPDLVDPEPLWDAVLRSARAGSGPGR